MIQYLTSTSLDKLVASNKLAVLLFFHPECPICTEAKSFFQDISMQFNYRFYLLQLDDSTMEFYSQYEPKHPVMITLANDDGTPKLDESGNQVYANAVDENGEVIMQPEINIPKYYFFHNSNKSEDNIYGLLGKVEGFNSDAVLDILQKMEGVNFNEQA